MHSNEKKEHVVSDYAQSSLTVDQIAKKHGVSKPTVAAWVTKFDQPHRGRGRRKLAAPSNRDREILRFAEICTCAYLGRRFGTTKQNISRIVRRWKDWKPAA